MRRGMSAGLFDSAAVVSRSHAGGVRESVDGGDSLGEYRSPSQYAIAAAILAVLSPIAFFDWWLAAVPALAIVLGLIGWRQVASRPEVLTGLPLATGGAAFACCTLAGSLVWLSIQYAAELPDGYSRIDYAILQPAEGEPQTAVPESATDLDGRLVLLKGYMYPGKEQRGIAEFLLVRDQGDCCFGGNPKITDRVLVRLADRQGIDFTPRLVKIAGRFAVRPTGISALEGGVLYHLDDAFTR
jgi:hypothetical protein